MDHTTEDRVVALSPIFDSFPGLNSEYSETAHLIKRGQMYPHVFEVSEAILYRSPLEIGVSLVLPQNFQSQYGAGALGFAMIGKTGDPDQAVTMYETEVSSRKGNAIEAIASILSISEDLVMRLYTASVRHQVPARIIADYLAHN